MPQTQTQINNLKNIWLMLKMCLLTRKHSRFVIYKKKIIGLNSKIDQLSQCVNAKMFRIFFIAFFTFHDFPMFWTNFFSFRNVQFQHIPSQHLCYFKQVIKMTNTFTSYKSLKREIQRDSEKQSFMNSSDLLVLQVFH